MLSTLTKPEKAYIVQNKSHKFSEYFEKYKDMIYFDDCDGNAILTPKKAVFDPQNHKSEEFIKKIMKGLEIARKFANHVVSIDESSMISLEESVSFIPLFGVAKNAAIAE